MNPAGEKCVHRPEKETDIEGQHDKTENLLFNRMLRAPLPLVFGENEKHPRPGEH